MKGPPQLINPNCTEPYYTNQYNQLRDEAIPCADGPPNQA